MYAGASPSDSLQRAVGGLRVALRRRGDATVLDTLYQNGCLKARFPRPLTSGWADVVTLNTSGGIAGGDRLDAAFDIAPGAQASIAAQAAERFYRALGGVPSLVRTRLTVGQGASAEWLPQETILFDRSALDRRLEIDLAADAWFLGVETLVFGRAAMGETVRQAWLRDVVRLRRDGRLLLHDAIRLQGEANALLQRATIGGGARAVATLWHVATQAEAALDAARSALAGVPVECGVSAWDGMLVARFLADDAAPLRQAVVAALAVLRGGRPLPRMWFC